MHYKLAPAQAQFHRKLLDCLSCCFTEVPSSPPIQNASKNAAASLSCSLKFF